MQQFTTYKGSRQVGNNVCYGWKSQCKEKKIYL